MGEEGGECFLVLKNSFEGSLSFFCFKGEPYGDHMEFHICFKGVIRMERLAEIGRQEGDFSLKN